MMPGNDIAVVIGACVAGLGSLVTIGMQVINFVDTRKLKRMSFDRDIQIKQVKDLVNGKSEVLTRYVAQEAYEKGREHERVAPGTPSPIVAVAPVQSVVTGIQREAAAPLSPDAHAAAKLP